MTSLSDLKEYYSTANVIIITIHGYIDDYINAIPEAKEFLDKCDESLKIAKIHQQRQISTERMKKAIDHIKDSEKKSKEIVNNSDKDKNLWGKAKFNVILMTKANSYRKYFKDKSEQFSNEMRDVITELDSIAPETPVKLPTIAKVFWINHFEETSSVVWNVFKEKYTSENSIDDENMNKFKKYLCIDDHVTIYAFYSTCSQLGYPIMLPVENHIDTMKLTELIMNLNKEFYNPIEMGQHWAKMTALHRNYKEVKNLLNHLITMKENKEEWLRLNISRGIVSSLFQRYMMIWRIGKVSQEMFDNVDFPGKARIRTFIHVCETIDKVNYGHLELDQEKEWEKGRPQVYDFLRAVLNNK